MLESGSPESGLWSHKKGGRLIHIIDMKCTVKGKAN